ncbi:PAS domain S-box protein, partial [bacterium]|nr:PAS domain S-box protein [bacterium]
RKPSSLPLEICINTIKGSIMTNRDETEVKAEMENMGNKFSVVFHKSLDALIILDSNKGLILEANDTCKIVLGYEKQDLLGKHISILFPEESDLYKKISPDDIKVFGSVFVQEFKRADGSLCMMDLTLTMIPWKEKTEILATFRDVSDRVRAEKEREKLICDLKEAMERIKTLRGLLPICMHCKKIRNDKGYWQQVEDYVQDHSEAEFSHGICPECIDKYYPELNEDMN